MSITIGAIWVSIETVVGAVGGVRVRDSLEAGRVRAFT